MGFMGPGADEPRKVIGTALARGINVIDTARGYYESERLIGEALKDWQGECLLASKSFMRKGAAALKELQTSLKNFGVEKVFLYQIHNVQYDADFDDAFGEGGALAALKDARRRGLIDFIGVSSHRPEMALKCIDSGQIDVVQIPVSLVEIEPFREVIQAANDRDVGILGMKPLGGGVLENVEAAIKFALNQPIATTLVGCATVAHVEKDVAAALSFASLSEEDRQALQEEAKKLDEKFCRRCRYCEAECPQGLPIAEIFRTEDHLIMSARYARAEYRRLPQRATECEGCGKCELKCPYQLPIRERLKTAHRRLTRGRFEDLAVKMFRRLGLYDIARKVYFALGGPMPKR